MNTANELHSLVMLGAALVALAGCDGPISSMSSTTSPPSEAAAVDDLRGIPAKVHGLYSKIRQEGERNKVLNSARAALALMELGHKDPAAKTLDEALLVVETIYGGDSTAAQARGTFAAEDRQDLSRRALRTRHGRLLNKWDESLRNRR